MLQTEFNLDYEIKKKTNKKNNYPMHVPRPEVYDAAVDVTWVSCPYLKK